MSDAPLHLAELFKPGIDWRHPLVTLYERHLRSGDHPVPAASLPDKQFLERWITRYTVVTDHGLRIEPEDGTASGNFIPDVELTWAKLKPWLKPRAPCTGAGG